MLNYKHAPLEIQLILLPILAEDYVDGLPLRLYLSPSQAFQCLVRCYMGYTSGNTLPCGQKYNEILDFFLVFNITYFIDQGLVKGLQRVIFR